MRNIPVPALHLSPSFIARYFYHECDRYLRYHATPARVRAAQGVPRPERATSLVTQAFLERGYAWEEEVIRTRLRGRVMIAAGDGRLHTRTHSVEQTLVKLQRLSADQYLYQPTLEAPNSFLARYDLDPNLCRFSACRPDLLMLEEDEWGRWLRIIDIKASDELRASHLIQTALYALILREVLEAKGSDLQVDFQTAGIWLYRMPEPHWFSLDTGIRIVERFLREDLTRILSQPLEEVPWHLFFRCEWCEFYRHCRTEAEETDSVSLLPYLSVGGRRYLREASWGGEPIHTLEGLRRFLHGPDQAEVDAILNACGNLRNRRERLITGIAALQTQMAIAHGGSSLAMPINEQVKIILTLQSDPYSGEIYAAGFLRLKGVDVYGKGSRLYHRIAASPEACVEVRADFLKALFDELHALHQYNACRNWEDQKSMQAYVFDSYERPLFNQLLLDALDDPDLAPYALQMLFYFQDEGLAHHDQHPEPEVPYPLVVLTEVIRQLVALPTPLVLRLPEVVQALPLPGRSSTLTPHELFWFELSNPLKSDAIAMAWDGSRPEAMVWIKDELMRRLWATSAVVDGLREQVNDQLFAWPPKFQFPGARVFQHAEFSQLAFIARYESFMEAMAVRTSRTRPWEERVRDGISIPLQHVGGDRWQVLAPLDVSMVAEDWFYNRLLVPDGRQGERAQMGYNDYRYRRAMFSLRNKDVWIAAITDLEVYDGSSEVSHLSLDIKGDPSFVRGARVVLHPRFTDWNTDRIVDCLGILDTQPDNELLRLIRDPTGFAEWLTEPSTVNAALTKIVREGFTSSQRQAFRQVARNRLTLVWGPPGTGKTYFLARALLCLAEAYWQAGYVLRVGVTAFTHAAIENLLQEIEDVAAQTGLGEFLQVRKLRGIRTPRGEGLGVLSEEEAAALAPEEPMVLGGTVYSLRKAREAGMGEFDLLVVDEASQMTFGEFALAIPSLVPERGRLILAGDDLQLPPIINGQYPEREDGLPGLQDSIFAYLRARDDEHTPYTWQLLENWRMNATLCQFPATTLYGSGYKPVTDEVANRRIFLAPQRRDASTIPELLDWILDAEYSLVVGVLEGVQATTENRLEAEVVAHLACELRARMRREDGRPYPNSVEGDDQFWRQGLFIVSPHHAQISTIQQALQRLRSWHAAPFVDTVDKMQGQQAWSVIVSYGVSDTETALQQAEFIYRLNRLNVAITRAKAKCVVFLPKPLLEPSLDLLRNDIAEKGLSFMQALIDYCAEGQAREFDLAPFPHGAAARLRVLRAG